MKCVLAVMLLLLPLTLAVTIEGDVYNLALDKVNNAIVEINTTPHQKMVADDGSYKFNVPEGIYNLSAAFKYLEADEVIIAESNGTFVFDLILIPSLDEEGSDNLDYIPEIDSLIQEKPAPLSEWIAWIVLFAVLAYIIFKLSKKPETAVKQVAVDSDLKKILNIIETQGGRTTQKEIRKELPHSEAKISLMLAELEGKGLIQRIKKGRSNIILKK